MVPLKQNYITYKYIIIVSKDEGTSTLLGSICFQSTIAMELARVQLVPNQAEYIQEGWLEQKLQQRDEIPKT